MWFDSIILADRDTWTKLRALFCARFAEQKFLKFRHSKEMFTSQQGQKEPVLEYISRIQTLARKSSDAPSVDMIIHAVMGGVKGYIAGYLAEKAPATIADLIKHASVAEGTLGDTEPVSASQLQQLQDDMKAQFDALSIKLSTGVVANVAEEQRRRVRFSPTTSRSPSADRRSPRRYNRFENERDNQSTAERSVSRVDGNNSRDYRRPVTNEREQYYTQSQTRQVPQRNDRYHWTRGAQNSRQHRQDSRSVERCHNCNGNVHNDFTQCPSYGLRCLGCNKWGHVIKCCRSRGQGRGRSPYVRGGFHRGGNGVRGDTPPPRNQQQY